MFVFCLILSIIGLSTAIFSPIVTNDVGLHVVDMIRNHGYPAEKYHLTTPDDYILEIHRIPYGLAKNNNSKAKRRILLMHGILGSSVDYVAMGPECALAYILADLDYDVWIGNTRGNLYTRKHAYLDPDIDKKKFWDFSFHEIGYYDLPTIIDFILQITGVDDLYYVCLSQGCTAFSVLMATRPSYNSKIRIASLMGPAIIMTHTRSQIVNGLAFNIDLSMALFKIFGIYEATPTPLIIQRLTIKYCGMAIFQNICGKLLALVVGGSGRLTYKEIIPVAATSDLVGVSMKQLYHYAQIRFLNRFAQFDYGFIKNILVYGKIVPPAYNLSLITAPTAVYYSEADTVVDLRDVRTLIKILPNVILSYQVPSGDFSHTDYVLSKYAVELIYSKLIETMKRF